MWGCDSPDAQSQARARAGENRRSRAIPPLRRYPQDRRFPLGLCAIRLVAPQRSPGEHLARNPCASNRRSGRTPLRSQWLAAGPGPNRSLDVTLVRCPEFR
jgi:hypothetical protein